jgi:ABC-2 type transport system permease protein
MIRRLERVWQVAAAFVRMGFLLEISYPLVFVLTQLQALVPIFTYYFVAGLVRDQGPSVGYDYFTFVVIGTLTLRIVAACLGELSSIVDEAIQQGRLEMLLVEPIRWRLLPFGLVQWPLFVRFVGVTALMAMTVPMGAHYKWSGLPLGLLITLLGAAASLAIGTLAMSVKVLSKRSDPILAVYAIVAQVLSGVYFPLEQLPRVLRGVAWLIPQTYVIAGDRQVLMPRGSGVSGPSPAGIVVILVVFCVVGFSLALWVLGRTLNYARRIGVLGGY